MLSNVNRANLKQALESLKRAKAGRLNDFTLNMKQQRNKLYLTRKEQFDSYPKMTLASTIVLANKEDFDKNLNVCSKQLYNSIKALPRNEFQVKIEQGFLKISDPNIEKIQYQVSVTEAKKEKNLAIELDFCTVDFDEFLMGLKQTYRSTSDDEMRFFLNGIYLELDGDNFNLVGTDGKRMAISHAKIKNNNGFENCIVPKEFYLALNALSFYADKKLHLAIFQESYHGQEKDQYRLAIYAKSGSMVITCTLIDGTFPAYRRAIPDQNYQLDEIIIIKKDEFRQSLKELLPFIDKKSKRIYLTVKDQEMQLVVRGKSEEDPLCITKVRYQGEGKAVTMAFNCQHLLQAVETINSSDIEFYYRDEYRAIELRTKDNNDANYIIMTMQID